MKKFSLVALMLVLISGQAFAAITITKSLEERVNDAQTGNSYVRVTGTIALDSSHPAEGETLHPSMLGMDSFTRVNIGPAGPASWTAQTALAAARNARRFGFDYTANRFYVLSVIAPSGTLGGAYEVSGPITYDLSYLATVPFEAVGAIS